MTIQFETNCFVILCQVDLSTEADRGQLDLWPEISADALVATPGHVISRPALLAMLPSGTASSEHAVEMAVARLRAALGTRSVQTVVKRGYRLAVAP